MQPGKFVDPAENYENLAQAWASHLNTPFDTTGRPFELCLQLIDALWSDVYPETIEAIEIDPHLFAERVDNYRYGLSTQVFYKE